MAKMPESIDMTVKVSFVSHICDVEFSDEVWIMIEAAARVENQTPQEWINSALSAHLKEHEENVIS